MRNATKRHENIVARDNVAFNVCRVVTPCSRLSKSHTS